MPELLVFTLVREATLPIVFHSFQMNRNPVAIESLVFRDVPVTETVQQNLGVLPDAKEARAFFLVKDNQEILVVSLGRVLDHSFHQEEFPLKGHKLRWAPSVGHRVIVPSFQLPMIGR